ncbi:MAG: FAD-dependent thymidylate synthase [Thermincola sp.]|nr:FAD-dependent thymidylate synthase [Thermincola sp.]MDT3704880.1 FAD-dependent thymidylate synthase [Thermincola sp.]
MMKVKLINHTPEPDKTVAAAARLCYSPVGAEQIMEDFSAEGVRNFLQKLMELGHWSPTEHVSFTFAVEGVSRALSHQLVRHRIASYSQQSQRYVRLEDFTYITPPTIQKDPQALEVFQAAIAEIRQAYQKLAGLVPAEDARYILPNACETKIVLTFNCRSLYNFFEHRCCERAQWEIRRMANLMLAEVKKAAPLLFAKAGPSCVARELCPEGTMSCGRINKLKK